MREVFLSLIILGSMGLRAGAQEAAAAGRLADQAAQLAQSGQLAQAEAVLRKAVALAPANPRLLAELGSVLGNKGKLQEASSYFQKALKIDPTNISIRRDLAATEMQQGQWEQAKRNLEEVLRTKPHDPPGTLLLGMVAANMKDYKTAAPLLASVPGLVRRNPAAIAALARSYYKTGDTSKARDLLMALISRPVPPQNVFLGAEMAEEAHDVDTASRLFESIRSNYPDQAAMAFHLAHVRYEAGDYAQSQTLLEQLIHDGHGASKIYNLLGWCYERQNRPDDARKALEMAITLKPSQEANYADLTNILSADKKPREALEVANRWAGRIPSSYPAHIAAGKTRMDLGFYSDAVRSYKQALDLDPSSKEALLGLGSAEAAAGLTTQAEAVFEKGIHRFPRDSAFYAEYGGMLLKPDAATGPEVKRRAVLMLEKAASLDSSDSQSRYLLGNFWLGQGKEQQALPYLTEADHLAPKQSEVHFALWRAYRKLGMSRQAAQEMNMFQELRKAASSSQARDDAD